MRLTLPDIDVAVTLTFSIGRLSVPVTRPRITSACARSPGAARKIRAAAPTAARTRHMSDSGMGRVSRTILGVRRKTTHQIGPPCLADGFLRPGGCPQDRRIGLQGGAVRRLEGEDHRETRPDANDAFHRDRATQP